MSKDRFSASSNQPKTSALTNRAGMPLSAESFWAKLIASSLISIPVTSAPIAARLRLSWPELH